MNKTFWKTIRKNEYAIPEGYTAENLAPKLLSCFASPDPELRDDLAYSILTEWVDHDFYTYKQIREMMIVLSSNLEIGIGEKDTDSVFLRTFSILALALMIYHDNNKSFLKADEVETLLEKGLEYLHAEKDPRGYIQIKGWAHALAHTADLMLVLAENRHTNIDQHIKILDGIAKKLINSTDWVYLHGEDDRLSAVVIAILQRNLIELPHIEEWLSSLATPVNGFWKGAWTKEDATRAFFNLRNFLRSLYLQITREDNLENKTQLQELMLKTMQSLKAY
ncbi:MAG: DUF2785 domain-containing protein [Anaerolineae bacterium]|jgi:hypothetical protein|nr:DUF2785 domain-containing protein [Anaerolineae bacterium]MBT3713259.1 DUF2785 domain-containing protein [Anaerolineae bacterium]MBT4312552.1 DUF2785 domain-containing protein [Anaerolineae bacterium]MBT4457675.1 DUF2785 domain-containing protein [Anaerolineae bacterium]MBT4841170.1 DUF2785 domain-containing protein [Anaerolineae bacterium]